MMSKALKEAQRVAANAAVSGALNPGATMARISTAYAAARRRSNGRYSKTHTSPARSRKHRGGRS